MRNYHTKRMRLDAQNACISSFFCTIRCVYSELEKRALYKTFHSCAEELDFAAVARR